MHGISPDDVANKPVISFYKSYLEKLFSLTKDPVCYNLSFDLDFLTTNLHFDFSDFKTTDVMLDFAPVYGEFNDYFQNYKWQKLTTAAAYYNFEFKAHDAFFDCLAAAFVHESMKQEKDQILLEEIQAV